MSESFYMSEIDEVLENVERAACNPKLPEDVLKDIKDTSVSILVARFGLNRDDAENSVASAAGEDL